MKSKTAFTPLPALPRSLLLTRLEAAIARATDPIDIACAQAERAALLARHGHVQLARNEIDILRTLQQRTGNLRLGAWLQLADGLADYFVDLELDARRKIDRAYCDSAAARMTDLHAQAAAWLAHFDSVHLDIDAMARHASQALHLAAADDHATGARACLVVADAYYFAARLDQAQPWYRASRRHCTAIGDAVTVSALMHNMAQLNGHLAREAALFGAHDPAQVRQALLGAESSLNFDTCVGIASLGGLVPALRAQMLVLLDRHDEALELFSANLPRALADGQHKIEAAFRSDMAWSHLKLGDRQAALVQAEAADSVLDERCTLDERALSHKRLAQVFGELGQGARSALHAQRAATFMAEFAALRERIVEVLDKALVGIEP